MNSTDSAPPAQSTPEPITLGRIISHFLFGIFLPAFTLGFEIVTGFSDEIYINPIPSLFHVVVVGLVPAILALNLYRCTQRQFASIRDIHLNSACIAITMVYAVIYLVPGRKVAILKKRR